MGAVRATLVWAALGTAIAGPVAIAATSPLLAWRDPVYIAAGFAGVMALALVFVQPLLAGGALPGLAGIRGRRAHRATGALLVAAVVIHVAGLWLTSPPDVIDALLFASPTPFSAFGVVAMWAVFAAAAMAAFRRRLALRPPAWRRGHTSLVTIAALGAVIHALLIEGTMGPLSKAALSALALGALAWTLATRRVPGGAASPKR